MVLKKKKDIATKIKPTSNSLLSVTYKSTWLVNRQHYYEEITMIMRVKEI